ncbi:3-oxoacyl-ACP reductase FabG [Actinomadura viridis]|uniref:NAD(P)-dependent dehydrogenase (Short-subunit alcohol dehydrogenase family) n=1 Tax=Actinomadura viridis TaxID=58110 RepID=A0A931GPC2_9ACTN|nr:SDR family oxidoreductase [Actinomadura viridis]MBG6090456.1 NAD(P)-dependent dehydrogenase (short-subunit alcohol dehydrogenase family) [Actinomadura viridis]
MAEQLAGRTALVTGGGRGIGAAIALRLAGEGADVAITYVRAADRARKVVAEIEAGGRRATAIQADSADPDAVVAAVDRTAAELGRLDILVNNAGIAPYGPLEDVTLEEVDRTLAVHARAVFVASQAAARHLGPGGRIISIGSSLAERVPYEGWTLYSMSKSALLGLTRGLARDLGPRGITANVVQPGSIDTEMNPDGSPESETEKAFIALGRYGRAEEIAAMVAHLAGPGGAYVTGAAIPVDGGVTA